MHIPVLLTESIEALCIKKDGIYVDGTLGGASHALEIANHLGPDGTLIGFDLDSNAIARAKEKLAQVKCKVILMQENFRNMGKVLAGKKVDGILLDLGWSSFQIADASRGFSFQEDGPLKMTFATEESVITAWDIVNTWDEYVIADMLYAFGDERASRKIAKAIIDARREQPIQTTFDLVKIVESVIPRKPWSKISPATKTFQALRIAVNDEYGALKEVLEAGFALLQQGGRFCVISFHSGEDRIVKNFFREQESVLITKKPITASDEELQKNPRARSAKMRVVEKK